MKLTAKITSDLRMALDPVVFAREGLGFYPDEAQERILRSNSKRLILNCCRQYGKSAISAVKGLHRAIFYLNSLILLLSPSLRQSSELFRRVANFAKKFPNMPEKIEDSKLFMTLENKSRIVSLPGKESTIRCYSDVALIVVDEASQVSDDLYYSIRPMLAISGGSLVLLSTPRGKRGFYHHVWKEGGDEWEKIQVKADECKRIPKEFLKEEYEALGRWWYAQEYQCEFVDAEGQLFTYNDIEAMHTGEVKPFFSGTSITSDVKPFFTE
jgi:hypothetical protein